MTKKPNIGIILFSPWRKRAKYKDRNGDYLMAKFMAALKLKN